MQTSGAGPVSRLLSSDGEVREWSVAGAGAGSGSVTGMSRSMSELGASARHSARSRAGVLSGQQQQQQQQASHQHFTVNARALPGTEMAHEEYAGRQATVDLFTHPEPNPTHYARNYEQAMKMVQRNQRAALFKAQSVRLMKEAAAVDEAEVGIDGSRDIVMGDLQSLRGVLKDMHRSHLQVRRV